MVELSGTVNFNGAEFLVRNSDNFAWTNCKLEVNPTILSSGFVYRANAIPAGSVSTVSAMQFATPDGQRFNPVSYKPTSVSISCDTPKGKGFYSGEWK